MIQKQNQAFEHGFGGDIKRGSFQYSQVIVRSFLKHKIIGLSKGLFIPDNLIAEAERFSDRNFIEEANYECCPRCLKAHVLKKAEEVGLTKKDIEFLETILPGEAGHNGYYLDENKVVSM